MSDSRAYGGSLRLRSGGAYMRYGRESGMGKWMVGIAFLGLLGCSSRGAPVSAPSAEPKPARFETPLAVAASDPEREPGEVPAAGPVDRRVSRMIEDDPDADGIANYRVIITDTFDADGNLVSTTRDEDFEADGIIDARSTTYLGS